jgi:hypothetical protein
MPTTYSHITVPTGTTPADAADLGLLVFHRNKEEAVAFAWRRGIRDVPTTFYQLTEPQEEDTQAVEGIEDLRQSLLALIPDLGPSSVIPRHFLIAKAEEELMQQLHQQGASTAEITLVACLANELPGATPQ